MGIYAINAAFIIAGNFKKADLRRIAPIFFQHISCNTRGNRIRDMFQASSDDNIEQASYALRKTIKTAKRQYKDKIEPQFTTSNYRHMWQGLHTITDYKDCKHTATNNASSLPDELNAFYARFKVSGPPHTEYNIRKPAGPDGIPGRVLKTCTHQLAGVFTDIFNLSLSLSVVPQCFRTSTIVPIQKTPKASCLNDWHPVALTPIISKCFEKLTS